MNIITKEQICKLRETTINYINSEILIKVECIQYIM